MHVCPGCFFLGVNTKTRDGWLAPAPQTATTTTSTGRKIAVVVLCVGVMMCLILFMYYITKWRMESKHAASGGVLARGSEIGSRLSQQGSDGPFHAHPSFQRMQPASGGQVQLPTLADVHKAALHAPL
jgi:hypothetical protein